MWNPRRQDSVSTYEEVESLHSHQCTTFNSLEGSSCPSRLESVGGSSAGSLDHALPPNYAHPPAFSAYQNDAPLIDPRHLSSGLRSQGSTDSSSRATSNLSYPQSPADLGTPSPLEVAHDDPRVGDIKDKSGNVNASVANWVNQSYSHTPNSEKGGRHLLSPKADTVKSNGQGVRGDSIERLDAEASPLTYRSMSPLQTFTRTASLDSGFPHMGQSGGFGMPWTPAENMLMTLGFGAVDFGIPERFMQSWRDNVIKRRIGELSTMLSAQHGPRGAHPPPLSRQASEADSLEDFRINPKPRISPPSPIQEQRERENQANAANAPKPKVEIKKISQMPVPSEKQKQLEKLNLMRRRFKKAATVGSFSSHLLRPSSSQPNSTSVSPCSTPELQRRQSVSSGKKLVHIQGPRGTAKDRRRKFVNRQSSLPISLETLPEEDEGQRSKPQSISDSFMAQRSVSIDVGQDNVKDIPPVPPLKIVTEQASLELSEAMSYGISKQESKDEAIADMNGNKKDLLNMEQYLSVIKTMIDSKDSGIGNDPSNDGSPQMSPRTSASEDDNSNTVKSAEGMRGTTEKGTTLKHTTIESKTSEERMETGFHGEVINTDKHIAIGYQNSPSGNKQFSNDDKNASETLQGEEAHATHSERQSAVVSHPIPVRKPSQRPSLTAMTEAFCQTVVEEDEEEDCNSVFDTGSQKKKVDASTVIDKDVGVQTSPDLMSPLLSPLIAGQRCNISFESSCSSERSQATTEWDVKPQLVLPPDSMHVEVNSNQGASTEDDASSTGTVNTQISELSSSSNFEYMFQHKPVTKKKSIPNNESEEGRNMEIDARIEQTATSCSSLIPENNYSSGDLDKDRQITEDIVKRKDSHTSKVPQSESMESKKIFYSNQDHRSSSDSTLSDKNSLCKEKVGDVNLQTEHDTPKVVPDDVYSGEKPRPTQSCNLFDDLRYPSKAHNMQNQSCDTSLPSQENQMEVAKHAFEITKSDSGSSMFSTHMKSNVSKREQSDDDEVDSIASLTGSELSVQSHDFAVPQLSHASSGIFHFLKQEQDISEAPKIRANVVSSDIGRQYEALLKSALEKERARKHLTVTETLHLAMVKLEKIVKERRLCRHTQLQDGGSSKISCKFCDSRKNTPGNVHKRYSLRPEVSLQPKQVTVLKQEQKLHKSVERTRSAPNELIQRAPSQEQTPKRGTEARVNSVSSDFNDAAMSVTGDNLLIDLDKVSEELPSDITLTGMTVADVKSIQAFHVLHENESLSLTEGDEKAKKEKEDSSQMLLQRRRSLFARNSKSGSRLLLANGTTHRNSILFTKESTQSKEFFEPPTFHSSADNKNIFSTEDAQKQIVQSVKTEGEAPFSKVTKGLKTGKSSSLSLDDSKAGQLTPFQEFDKRAKSMQNLSSQSSSFYIIVNQCNDSKSADGGSTDSDKTGFPSLNCHQTPGRSSSDKSMDCYVMPQSSPRKTLSAQNSKRSSSPFSPTSLLSSPQSSILKTPPIPVTDGVGESPIPPQLMRLSQSPTVNLASSTPSAHTMIELSTLDIQPDDVEGTQPLASLTPSKFRSEVFLQLPDQTNSANHSVRSVSPVSVILTPVSPLPRLEYMPSFDELCDKAQTIITDIEGLGEPTEHAIEQAVPIEDSILSVKKVDDDNNELQHEENETSSTKAGPSQGVQHREGNIHHSEEHRLQPSSNEHPGVRIVGQPQMSSTPHPSHSGGAGYMEQQRHAEQQAVLQNMTQSENSLRTSLEVMQASLKELKTRKQDAVDELKTLQEAVKRNKSDIQQAEEMARMSVEKGDGLRSELMVLEYQRDQARRELKDLEEGITARRNPQDNTRGSDRGHIGSTTGLAQIGLSVEEMLGVIRERDDLQAKLEKDQGNHVSKEEHEEVLRQLDQTKQELFENQKASRTKLEKLQEDLEEGRGKIESLKLIESDLKKELSETQETLKNSENDHQKQLLEKTTTIEELKGKATTETADLRHKLSESTQRITTLESALLDKDVVTTRMQERIRGQGQEVLELTNKVDELEKEREKKARKAETVKEVALVELRGKLLKEKDEELDQQKKMLEKTHQDILIKEQTQSTERLTKLEKENEEKDCELNELREKLSQQEISKRTLGDQMRLEAQEQIQKALEEQKAIFETESEKERQREALAKEDAVAIETKHLREELKREKQLRDTLKTSHSNMKEELEKLRDENLGAGREKVEAVSKAREEARQEIQIQLDQIRDQMAQEKTRETEKLQQKLKQQDDELTQLRTEVKGYRQKQRDSSSSQSSLDQSYRSIVMELNEECRKTSNLVGSTPRKVPLFSSRNMKADSPSQTGSSKQASFNSPGRTQLMAAISNLKATNDDLRNYIKSLRDDLEKQRRATTRANREKDNEVKKLVESMGREKAQIFEGERDVELDRLQRSLGVLRDSEKTLQQELMNKDEELRQIQSNMAAWKEETALKMARKFEDELNKELEVRLEESHSGSGSFKGSLSDSRLRNSALGTSTPSSSVGSGETGTNKLLRHLQDRVKQLRIENTTLKQANRLDNSFDGGDSSFQKSLQLEEKDQQLYRLDQKVKLLERQLWVAEERCRENAALMSQKTAENVRLEGALTQQTKELMRVERAYNKLSHSTPTSPVP
ncbi:uncharacterized protein LOC129254925 [Lytechinus pictus]|uniref:uncharacterized protein LOC129254925 n=1 Tax=Lytechinus pictus TaxID=7653 RepID=UPI0030BA0E6F